MTSNAAQRNQSGILTVLLFYTALALLFGLAYRSSMNPDGISQLRLAGYIAEGKFYQSVSSGYPPLFTWIVAPLIVSGFDGLTSARIAIGICGAFLLMFSWLLAGRFELSARARIVAMLTTALLVSMWTIQNIGSDVLFAALILSYVYILTDTRILDRRSSAFLCGIAGGGAYLAHQYAFPFFLVHFPVLLLIRAYMLKGRSLMPWRSIVVTWSIGVAGFLIVTSAWICIISVKSGSFTISSSGGPAHAIMGPNDTDRRHPYFVRGLFVPKDPYAIHVFEDPSEVEFATWSPFESREYFLHQLKVIKINLVYILNHFVNKSPFFTYAFIVGTLALFPLALCLSPPNTERRYLYAWIITTFCIYCSGFIILIARSPRRFYALMIITVLLSFHMIERLFETIRERCTKKSTKILTLYFFAMVCAAFVIKPSLHLMSAVQNAVAAQHINPYKDMADNINRVDFPDPYAIIRSSQKPTTDYYVTYFLGKQLLGRPSADDVDGITEELRRAGGKSLLVFDNDEITEILKRDERYSHRGFIKLNASKMYEQAEQWTVTKHEILTGWDDEVNIFVLN